MTTDSKTRYRALTARDRRFDGLFFVGVTSTKIYCRPICSVRTPKEVNCRFFDSAQAAEQAGFRPCLRCRPELAPGSAPTDDAQRIAQAIVQRLEDGTIGADVGLEELAAHFELSSRQIRRIVRNELGVAPIQLLLTRRLLLAKQLLTESTLPVTEVAFASGFASLRRFNDAFRRRYGLAPTRLRKRAGMEGADSGELCALRLDYRPPYDFGGLLAFLRDRALAGVEWVTYDAYTRTVQLGDRTGWIRVTQTKEKPQLRLELTHSLLPVLPALLRRVRDLFDLAARPDVIAAQLRRDPTLAPLVKANPGLRVPGAFSGFEMGLRAILGQQVTVKAATTIAGRLVATLGERIATPFPALTLLSPTPARVARATVDDLAAQGIPGARCKSLVALAKAQLSGALPLEEGVHPDPDTAIAKLAELPGVGAWTAHYIAMRALRWPDAFPSGDVAVRNNLGGVSTKDADGMSQAWRPWRSYAVLHIWNRSKVMSKESQYVYKEIASPVGRLRLVASDDGLAAILWESDPPRRVPLASTATKGTHPVLAEAERQLAEYFAGERTTFDLPLAPTGTPFQRKVWGALLTIPFGETRSYGEIAAQIGSPSAVRAVGAANGKNPISIVAPCHRVIGASGKLTGFAGGLETKAYLLALEGRSSKARTAGASRGGSGARARAARIAAARS
jgi:AraC family transcriptional regulator, regulatory protein of adaptative response / DNA-3-methyladenine glycosylase II